jgi:hypothetical protein
MRLLPSILAVFLLWIEIDHPLWHGGVRVRVMDSEFTSDLYQIQRSTDCGRTWQNYLLAVNGEWNDAGGVAQSAIFRATIR